MEDLKAGREGDRASAEMPAPPAREQAREILAAVGAPVTLRPMPVVRQLSGTRCDAETFGCCRRALEQVLAEIAASERRCADLEEVAEIAASEEPSVIGKHHAPSSCPAEVLAGVCDLGAAVERVVDTWDAYLRSILAAAEMALGTGGGPAVHALLGEWGVDAVLGQVRAMLRARGLGSLFEGRDEAEVGSPEEEPTFGQVREPPVEEPRVVH
jgi:hypothetical protein